jgi:hypothetical protein
MLKHEYRTSSEEGNGQFDVLVCARFSSVDAFETPVDYTMWKTVM